MRRTLYISRSHHRRSVQRRLFCGVILSSKPGHSCIVFDRAHNTFLIRSALCPASLQESHGPAGLPMHKSPGMAVLAYASCSHSRHSRIRSGPLPGSRGYAEGLVGAGIGENGRIGINRECRYKAFIPSTHITGLLIVS